MNNLILIASLAGMALAAWMLFLAFQESYGTPVFFLWDLSSIRIKIPWSYHRKMRPYRVKRSKPSKRSTYRNSREYRKLLELVRYDQATADRLVAYARNCNPGKPDKWVLEKALWDLERDRR